MCSLSDEKMPAYRWFAEGKRQRFYARNRLKTTLEPWKPPAVPTRNRVWMLICQGAGFSWVFALACIISFECGRFDLVAGCARQLQWPPNRNGGGRRRRGHDDVEIRCCKQACDAD